MVRKNTDPQLTDTAIEAQRALIKDHLTRFILADSVPIDDERSFFQVRPVEEDDEACEFYDRAQGDPGLYAVYWAMEYARNRLEEAQIEGKPAQVEMARADLAEVAYLELAYKDPDHNPFVPVAEEEPPF
ncbi:MAG TPA: hypothetical protein VGE30_00955 [Candidatus Saccharimonadales bacterium]